MILHISWRDSSLIESLLHDEVIWTENENLIDRPMHSTDIGSQKVEINFLEHIVNQKTLYFTNLRQNTIDSELSIVNKNW